VLALRLYQSVWQSGLSFKFAAHTRGRAELGNEKADQLLTDFLEECAHAAPNAVTSSSPVATTGAISSATPDATPLNLFATDSFFLVLARKDGE
jgi:hypothetical protein